MTTATNPLKARIETFRTRSIISLLNELGGGALDENRNTVRATLLKVYEEREGEDKLDEMLDKLGL